MSDETTTCESCGAPAPSGTMFCEACGARLGDEALPAPTTTAPDAPASDAAADDPDRPDADRPSTGAPGTGTPAADADDADDLPTVDLSAQGTDGPGTDPPDAAADDLDAPTPPRGTPRPATPCPSCGATSYTDGFCDRCGGREPQPRDHQEQSPAPWVAGVCDRGVTHTRNEDSQALSASPAPGRLAALVVCDGVSSVPRSDEASMAAALAALTVLDARLKREQDERARRAEPASSAEEPARPRPGQDEPGPVDPAQGDGEPVPQAPDYAALLTAAARAGDDAVGVVAGPVGPEEHACPSCTLVAAVVDDGRVAAAAVGDSRAYWLPDDGPASTLTTDDSWAQEMIAAGIPREQAEHAPQAHAITRWLGPDSPPVTPSTRVIEPTGPGWLCVCSDGLWNYCSDPDDLSTLIHQLAAGHDDPLTTARAAVDWVNARGGRDNVTVVLARLDPTTR